MTLNPEVSVCIPTFNAGALLEETLNSVLQQTHPSFEVVIVDDGSQDGTYERVQAYASDSRVRVFCNSKNLGMVENWNECLRQAKGRFIKLIGQDDVLFPECIKKQSDFLKKHPEVSLVTSPAQLINARSKHVTQRVLPWSVEVEDFSKILHDCQNRSRNLIGEPVCTMFERKRALAIGLFNPKLRYVVDLDFWLRLLRKSKMGLLHEPLVGYRVHTGMQSRNLLWRASREFIEIFEANDRILSRYEKTKIVTQTIARNLLRAGFIEVFGR